jgi:hypothetical protein
MAKEALVLWENYAQNTKPPYQGIDACIAWMLQSNNINKAKIHLSKLSAQQLDECYPELACLLGLLIITGKSELQAMLPSDSAFLTHAVLAQTALAAHRNNDRDGVERALQQLPFRSAFRDLRTLLKASLLFSESLEQARALLAKIPATSPYRSAANLLSVATDDGATLVNKVLSVEQTQLRLISAAKQLNNKQSELLDNLHKHKNHLSDKLKLNLAMQYQALFNNNIVYNYGLVTVLTSYTAGERDFIKHFGNIDNFERNRLLALSCENTQRGYEATYYWVQCIELLQNKEADNNYKIALIMRHIADREDEPERKVAYLIESLKYDEDDLESYLQILRYYENEKKSVDNFKQWLAKSIEKFPKNIEVLNLAINNSVRNKAFKKATQYALALLKIDPINTTAKQVLFSSHLAHARKLIKTKKFHLVEKELQQAESIALSKRHQILAAVMRGFYSLVTENKEQGLLQIASAVEKLNDGLFNSHFFVAMETLLLNLPITTALKKLPTPTENYVLSEHELRQLIQLILGYYDDDNNNRVLLQKALDKFKVIIKKSIKQQASNETLLLTLCECFYRIELFDWLTFCVKQANRGHKQMIWLYYQIVAKVKGNASKCSNRDIFLLENGLSLAYQQNDERTAMLISTFVKKYYDTVTPFNNFFGVDEEETGTDWLFAHLPESIFQKLENKVIDIVNKNRPEKMLKILVEQYMPNDVMRMIYTVQNNPDLLFTLLLLKAAEELSIDIGVTPNDVINSFGLK